MEQQRPPGFYPGGSHQSYKRTIRREKACLDPEDSHTDHTVRMDKENRHITLAYFEQRSTVDYIGAVQGIPVCFDAKECSVDTFPLSNIHPHQVEFMNAFEQQGGIAFFLIFFSHADLFYYLPLRDLMIFWNRMKEGGRKSFRREELNNIYYLQKKNGFLIPYLDGIQTDLKLRD